MANKKSNSKKPDIKNKLLRVSEKLFAQKGFAGTSIDDISKKAKITKSLIYYYFKNKQEILDEIIKRFTEAGAALEKELTEVIHANPKKSIKEAIEVSFDFAEKKKDVLKIMMLEAIKDSYKFPLFMYMDLWSKTSYNGLKQLSKKAPDEFEAYLRIFFTGFMPIISFIMFNEEWCRHYKINKNEAKEKLIELHSDLVKKWIA